MSRRLITTITPNTPTASYTYTGSGVGKIDLVAEVTLDDGTVQSNTYEVIDCIGYDKGLSPTGEHNDIWTTVSCGLSRGTEYSTVTWSSGNSYVYTPMSDSCRIEFDYYQVDGGVSNYFLYLRKADKDVISGFSLNYISSYLGGNVAVGNWYHINLRVENGAIYFGDSTTALRTFEDTPSYFSLFLNTSGLHECRFKNFMVYPI